MNNEDQKYALLDLDLRLFHLNDKMNDLVKNMKEIVALIHHFRGVLMSFDLHTLHNEFVNKEEIS